MIAGISQVRISMMGGLKAGPANQMIDAILKVDLEKRQESSYVKPFINFKEQVCLITGQEKSDRHRFLGG